MYEVEIYEDRDGNSELKDWLRELRPDKHRVMFFQVKNGRFILLSHFRKDTQKTPLKEIRKAKQLRLEREPSWIELEG